MTAKEARAVFDVRLQAVGGSFPTWVVLHTLEDHDGDFQRQLAEHCGIEGPTLTHHLDHLEANGFIQRRADATDRRATRVYLTAAGRRLLARLWEVSRAANTDLTEGFTEAEVEQLHAFHQRLLANIRAAAEADREARPSRPARRAPAART
ncbi:MAG TPA: MarR family transcriptional regulator [Actinomycetota bacterium]|jgi:MarR family transcriptional regulator for hemolysin